MLYQGGFWASFSNLLVLNIICLLKLRRPCFRLWPGISIINLLSLVITLFCHLLRVRISTLYLLIKVDLHRRNLNLNYFFNLLLLRRCLGLQALCLGLQAICHFRNNQLGCRLNFCCWLNMFFKISFKTFRRFACNCRNLWTSDIIFILLAAHFRLCKDFWWWCCSLISDFNLTGFPFRWLFCFACRTLALNLDCSWFNFPFSFLLFLFWFSFFLFLFLFFHRLLIIVFLWQIEAWFINIFGGVSYSCLSFFIVIAEIVFELWHLVHHCCVGCCKFVLICGNVLLHCMLFRCNFLNRLCLLGNSGNCLFHFIFFGWSFEIFCLWPTCRRTTLRWISNFCLLQFGFHESLHLFLAHRFSEASTSWIILDSWWLPRVHTDSIVQNILRVWYLRLKLHCLLWLSLL